MEEPLILYECFLCHVYLESYTKATIHLGMNHSEACTLKDNINKSLKNQREKTDNDEDLIKSREFPESTVILKRIKRTSTCSRDVHSSKVTGSKTTTTITRKPKAKARKHPGRNEIKLDTLKAGEIETLITDLFSNASTSSTTNLEAGSGQTIFRRSRRKVKENFNNNYRELDSEDDEVIKRGVAVGNRLLPKKTRLRKDADYDPSEDDSSPNVTAESGRSATLLQQQHYMCRICQTDFPDQVNYLKHMRKEHSKDGRYSCTYCVKLKAFHCLHDFNKHMSQHVLSKGNDDHTCKICGKVLKYVYGDAMSIHMKTHEIKGADDPTKTHECPHCHNRFANKHSLQRHFVLHLENNPFKCQFLGCGRKFNSDYNLKRHMAIHTDRIVHKCKFCPKKFCRPERLKDHVKKIHSKNLKHIHKVHNVKYKIKSVCELAPQNEITPNTKLNEKKDDEEYRFELESIHLADQREDQDIHLKGEKLSPTKELESPSPSICQNSRSLTSSPSKDVNDQHGLSIEQSQVQETKLKLYNIMNSDPIVRRIKENNPESLEYDFLNMGYAYNVNHKPDDFKCHICSWTGARAFTFQNHMKKFHEVTTAQHPSFLEDNPDNQLAITLTCGSCGYQSKSADDLSTHISKVHSNKKFVCSHCGIRFSNTLCRDQHVKRIHLTEKKFQCDQCNKKFHAKKNLKVHMSEKHDPEYQKMLKDTCKCLKCGKILCNTKSLKKHMKRHSDSRPVVDCKICGQNCADTNALQRHIRFVHFGQKNPHNKRSTLRDPTIPENTNVVSDSETPNKCSGRNEKDTADETAEIIGL